MSSSICTVDKGALGSYASRSTRNWAGPASEAQGCELCGQVLSSGKPKGVELAGPCKLNGSRQSLPRCTVH